MSDEVFEISPADTARRIKIAKSPITQREWGSYLYAFDLDKRDKKSWEGKVILDVGGGDKIEDPEIAFPGAKVCVIDPEIGGKIKFQSAHEKRKGVVQEIPYDDNKFDLVLSSHAVPQHIFPVYFPRAISEMIRVMKPGGEIRLTPCVEGHDITAEIEVALANSGFEVEFISEKAPSITVIRPTEKAGENVGSKRIAWENFHKTFFPKEKIRVRP